MTSLDKLTPKKLSKSLVKKHKELIKGYEVEYELLDRISILEEKKDQIDYWVESSEEGGKGSRKIKKQKKMVDSELLELKKDLGERAGSSDNANVKKRLTTLRNMIEEHNKALDYWKNKNKELSKMRA